MKPVLTVSFVFLAFAFLHSLTVSRAFKSWISGILGERRMRVYYRLLFTLFSAAITAAAAFIIAAQPDAPVYRPPAFLYWPARAIQLAGVVLLLASFRPFDLGYFTGTRQALEYLRMRRTGGDIEGMPGGALVTAGVYGLVRHPMYLAGIVIFLFEPAVTQNTLALRVLAVSYFLWGGLMEEKRFVRDFGEAYREYQKRVPMFNVISGIARRKRP